VSPAQQQRLQQIWNWVAEQRRGDHDPARIIAELVRDHGATFRRGDPHRLRAGGVVASCTWSDGSGLLHNWVSTASMRLIMSRQEAG